MVEDIGPDFYNAFVQQWEATMDYENHWFLMPQKATGPYDRTAIMGAFNNLRAYQEAVNALKTAVPGKSNSKETIIDLINTYFVGGGSKFKIFFKVALKYLSAARRVEILGYLAEGNIAGRWSVGGLVDAEDIIVTLLETAPADQAKTILDGLQAQKLLFPLFSNVDGTNFERLITKLTEWVFREYPLQKPIDLFAMADKNAKYFTRFNGNLFGRSNSEQVMRDGSVEIETVVHWYNTSDFANAYKFTAKPYEYIKVRFETDLQIGGSGFVAGKDYMLPALYVYLLFTNDTKQKWITTGKITLDVALTLLGGAEIVAAYRASSVGGFVLGAIDMGLGVGDIVLNQAFHDEIIKAYPENGEAFCRSWQAISMCYGIGRLGVEGLLADVNIGRKFSRKNKTNPDLTPETRKFLDDVDKKLNGPDFSRFANDVDDILAGIRAKFTRCGCAEQLDDFLVLRIRDKLTDAEIAKLALDFAGDKKLLYAMNNDQELVDVWKLTKEVDVIILKKVKNILNTRKYNRSQRVNELGKDLDKNNISITEGEAGFEIEEQYGYFERYKAPDNTTKGDWVSISGSYKGKTFDELGGGLGEMAISEFARLPKQKAKFFESIDKHFLKTDYVVLNLTKMKQLEPSLYNETIDYITKTFGTDKLINITK